MVNDAVVRGESLPRVKSMSWVCHKDRIGTYQQALNTGPRL